MQRIQIEPTTTNSQIITQIAEAFATGAECILGRYMVSLLEDGWDTQLVFSDVRGEKGIHTKDIDSDGPTHAATEAYHWWSNDAWAI